VALIGTGPMADTGLRHELAEETRGPVSVRLPAITMTAADTLPSGQRDAPAGAGWRDPAVLPRLALLVPVWVLLSTTTADPDLWGHVRFGQDMLAGRGIPGSDVYSFASDRPWVNHEWLAEVVFAAAYGAAGTVGLVALRLALVTAALAIVARALRRAGVEPFARALLIALAGFGIHSTAVTVRPQLFSLVAFAWLVSACAGFEQRGWRALAAAPAVMALWANLHGGWVVGFGTLCSWTVARILIGRLWKRPADPMAMAPWHGLGLLLVSGLATAANPHGVELWRFLAETVRFDRADITEWSPLTDPPSVELAIWVITCLVVVGAVAMDRRRGWRLTPAVLPTLAVLAFASWRVRRTSAFFVLAVVMLAGPAAARFVRRARGGASPSPPLVDALPQRWKVGLAAVALVAVAADGALRRSGRLGCVDTSDPRLPDVTAAAAIRAGGLEGRLLTWFDWGEYAIWHFSPRLRVSIDGRRETVYSDEMIQAHRAFYLGEDGIALVGRLNPDYVWLPAWLQPVAALDAAGWPRVYSSHRSVVFARPGRAAAALANIGPAEASTAACFP
jgi:hypothetical protein